MRIESFVKEADGIVLHTTKGKIKIEVCTEKIIRIVYTLNESFSDKPSLMIVQTDSAPVD